MSSRIAGGSAVMVGSGALGRSSLGARRLGVGRRLGGRTNRVWRPKVAGPDTKARAGGRKALGRRLVVVARPGAVSLVPRWAERPGAVSMVARVRDGPGAVSLVAVPIVVQPGAVSLEGRGAIMTKLGGSNRIGGKRRVPQRERVAKVEPVVKDKPVAESVPVGKRRVGRPPLPESQLKGPTRWITKTPRPPG